MRVIHVITRLIVGGAQENTLASVLGLRKREGLNVTLISGPATGAEGSLISTFDSCRDVLTVIPELVRPVHPWKDLRALRRLTAAFRRARPEIVHTHSGKAGVVGRLAAARARVPCIIHTIHGPSFGPFQGPIPNFVFRQAERWAARVTSHFVVVAHAMTRQYLAAGIGKPENYTRIVSGFDLKPFLAARNDPGLRARYGIAPDDLVVTMVARLFKLKGHEDLFSIAPGLLSEHPKVKFMLVGDGPYRERFEARVGRFGLRDRFVFVGLVPPEVVPPLLGITDILLHLSRREGLPRALPQALAAGRPVVAYDCDGASEACLDNQTGFLAAAGDRRGVTEKLSVLAKDPALCSRFGEVGRAFARDNFAVERMVDELHRLYLRLAGTSRPASVIPA